LAKHQQERRLKLLENALHEAIHLYTRLSDVVLSTEVFTAEHPHVMKDLQRSMKRILELAETADHYEVTPMTNHPGPLDAGISEEQHESVPEIISIEKSLPPANKRPLVSAEVTAIEAEQPFNISEEQKSGALEASRNREFRLISNDQRPQLSPRENMDLRPQLEFKSPSLQCEELMQKLNFFAFRLVEITLSRAYSVLLGAAPASSDEVHRTFGSTLRTRTREQILVDLRWLLGPGKKALPQASGYLWEYTSQNDAPPRWSGYPAYEYVSYEVDSDETSEKANYQSPVYPRLLTTLGVVQELLNLKARVIDSDTLEITLGHQGSINPRSDMESMNSYRESINERAFSPAVSNNFCDTSAESLDLRLSVPLLTVNLALVATCAKVGPVYPSNEVAKAVEAAIVMIGKDKSAIAGWT
jgi:hypothetical protein